MSREICRLVLFGTASISLLMSENLAFAQVKTTGRFYPTATATPKPTEIAKPVDVPNPQPVTQPQAPAPAVDEQNSDSTQPDLPKLEEGGRLDLICAGAGAANKLDQITSDGSFSGSLSYYGTPLGSVSGSTSSTTTFNRRDEFGDIVSLFIQGDEGRLRMPRIMLPLIRGGEDGWFKLKNIKVKPNEITAAISVNPLNNPKLRLDRYAGTISINGKAGDYSGVCKRIVPQETAREF